MRTPPCRKVIVRPADGAGIICSTLLGATVSRGTRIGTIIVEYCSPDPCIVTSSTDVSLGSLKSRIVTIEETDETVGIVYEWDGRRQVYVVDRPIWERLGKCLAEAQAGKCTMVLLHGPPGTGKSSFAKVAAAMLSFPVYFLRIDKVLTKYIGESERNLARFIRNVKNSAPCIWVIDECENFFYERGRESEGSVSEVMRNLQQILLTELQEIHEKNIPVLVIACTNKSEKFIDQAFRRVGRFDYVIRVPYPSWRAVYHALRLYAEYISEEKVRQALARHGVDSLEKFAKIVTNLGLSMSDIVCGIVEKNMDARTLASQKSARGYKRLVSLYTEDSQILRRYFSDIVDLVEAYYRNDLPNPCHFSAPLLEDKPEHDHRYWLLPVLVYVFTMHGIPVVYIYDQSNLDDVREGLLTAYESRGVAILDMLNASPTTLITIKEFCKIAQAPMIMINVHGTVPATFDILPKVFEYVRKCGEDSRELKRLIDIICTFMNVQEITEKVYQRIKPRLIHSIEDAKRLIEDIVGTVMEEVKRTRKNFEGENVLRRSEGKPIFIRLR